MVSRTILHPLWQFEQGQKSEFDLALLKLPIRVEMAVPNILVDHFPLKTGQKLVACGWGMGSNGPALGDDVFGSLKMESQQFIDGKDCNATTLWNEGLHRNAICGLSPTNKASCLGT